MLRAAAVLALALLASPAAAEERTACDSELAGAKRAYEAHRRERLRLAEPLARAVRQVVAQLDDADRALLARFGRGEVAAAEVDRTLWPKLFPALDRFNRQGCAALGGVVRAETPVEASTALRDGKGLHTGVVVSCARRPLQGEARRYLGLRVTRGEAGAALTLRGFVQRRETASASPADAAWEGVTVEVPLGDRAAEAAALEASLAAFTGTVDDFTWTVPASCLPRLTLAP